MCYNYNISRGVDIMKKIIRKIIKHYGLKSIMLETMALLGVLGVGYVWLLILCDIVKYGI